MRLNLARTLPRSAANGPGERFVLWVQGCPLACPGCWNPDTWAFERCDLRSVEDLAAVILATEGIEGVTFTGGEPFAQARALTALAERVRTAGLSVFVFTGYDLDELSRPESASSSVSGETRTLSTRAPRPSSPTRRRAEAPEKQDENGESADGVTVEALCKPPTVDDSRWGKMAPLAGRQRESEWPLSLEKCPLKSRVCGGTGFSGVFA